MGMTFSVLLSFAAAAFLLAMVPGPATALVVRRSALRGTRAAIPVIIGIEIGIFLWAVGAAVGVAALVAASEIAYTVLRIVGAGVLVALGVQAWRSARRNDQDDQEAPRRLGSWPAGIGTGLVTNLANPKAAVFAFAFYPQFVAPGADVLVTTLALGLLHVAIDICWYLLLACVVGRARTVFARPAVRRALEQVTGGMLVLLGVRLAAEAR